MIFMHGYVHCDPHAANLLDHGLYRSITDQFRHDYACLWQVGLPVLARLHQVRVQAFNRMCPGGVACSGY